MPGWWEPRPSSLHNSRTAGQITLMRQSENILERIATQGIVLGDGGYLIELERRGWVDSGSGREKVGTGKGSGQFTPEVAIEHPDALRELHREFLNAGSQVLQALTFFGTREKLNRAGYGEQTEAINAAAVRIAREVAGSSALVAGSVSRTQLCEREPDRMLAITRKMRKAVTVPIAAQPAAFRTTDATPCFTRLPQFPDEMEAIQLPRSSFEQFAQRAKSEGIQFLGGCCGCNAAYIHAFARGLAASTAIAQRHVG